MLKKILSSLKMTHKIGALAVGGAFAAAVGVGVVALGIAERSAVEAVKERKLSVVESRAGKLSDAFRTRGETLAFVGNSSGVQSALKQFSNALIGESRDLWPELRAAYIHDNPHPAGKRIELLEAPDASMFSIYHKMHHGTFRGLMRLGRYVDAMLISAEGRILYTASKRDDFGQSVAEGPLAGTGLAQVWKAAAAAEKPGGWTISDLGPYPISGANELFMATAVFSPQGKKLGVLAVALPDRTITSSVILGSDSVDGTAVYVVGRDGKMRSDVLGSDAYALSDGPQNALVKAAFADGEAEGVARGLFSEEATIAARMVRIGDLEMVLVAEEPLSHAMAGVAELRWSILSAAGALILFAVLAAAVLARSLAGPIRRMAESVDRLAKGELVEIPGLGRTDEVGVLAGSLTQIHAGALEAQRIRTALDGAATAMSVADAEFQIVYANTAMEEMLERSRGYWMRTAPTLAGDDMTASLLGGAISEMQTLRERLSKGEGAATLTASFDERSFEITGSTVLDADGAPLGYAIQWSETTDRRRIENEIARVIQGVADGDLDSRISANIDDPFVRELADGVNRICGLVDGFIGEIDQSARALADGDLTARMPNDHKGRFAELSASMNDAFAKLEEIVAGIRNAIVSVRDESGAIATNSTSLSERAESQAASLEETSATMEQISAAVQANAGHASSATELAQQASERAGSGQQVVHEAVEAMSRIENSSSRISDIISVIDGIAFQTNLLALNAAVEAARAGDAGKGFAVVASEVRTLAQRSAEAAKDIKGLIEESAGHVGDGVRLVRQTGDALEAMVSSVGQVSSTIADISTGGQQQAEGVAEITSAVRQMDDLTQANASMAQESASAAKALSGQAQELGRLVSFFGGGEGVSAADERQADAEWAAAAAAAPSVPSETAVAPQADAVGGRRSNDDWAEF